MELLYRSTRGAKEPVTASKAILQGLAEDGGLFVPDSIPKLTCSMEQLAGMTYQETAYEVMKLFLTLFSFSFFSLYPAPFTIAATPDEQSASHGTVI